MLTADQLATRRFFIGSSEAATACGLSPYQSRLQLWLEKTGRVPRPDLSQNPRVHFGNVLEPVVAAEYARRNQVPGDQCEKVTETVYSGIRAATIDYRIAGKILECKTADAYTAHLWRDGIPAPYRIQVEHQLMTTGEREAVLAVIIGGNDYREYPVTASPDLSRMIDSQQRAFIEHLDTDTPPPPESPADILALWPAPVARFARMTAPEYTLLAELATAQTMRTDYEKQYQALAARVQMQMRETTHWIDDDGSPLVSFTVPSGMSTDWRSVAAELAQHVAKNTFQQTVRKHSTRRARRFTLEKRRN